MTSIKSHLKRVNYLQSFSLFVIVLTSIFAFEGFGLPFGRTISFYLLLCAPFVLFLIDVIQKKPIYIPKQFFVLYGLFLVFTCVSAIQSVDVQRSFEYLLVYIALFLLSVYALNHTKEITVLLPRFIVGISIVFLLFSMLLDTFQAGFMQIFVPQTAYQMVSPLYSFHNHLGDFLIVPLLYLFYSFVKKPRFVYFLLFLLLFPHFLFSYSRSSYVALFVTVLCIAFFSFKKIKRKQFYIMTSALLVFLIIPLFFIVLSSQIKTFPLGQYISRIVPSSLHVPDKDLLSDRGKYFIQAYASITEKPLFGVGPDNFRYISIQHATYQHQRSDTSHNMFVDIFSENGIVAGIFFSILIVCCTKNFISILKSGSGYLPYLFLALLINFQSDYTFKIYSFLILFFILIASFYTEEKKIKASFFVILVSVLLFFWGILIPLSTYVKKDDSFLSHALYPFQRDSYTALSDKFFKKNNIAQAERYIKAYGELYSGDSSVLKYIARSYITRGKKDIALLYLEKAYQNNKYIDSSTAYTIYDLTLRIKGETEAKRFTKQYVLFFWEKELYNRTKYSLPREVFTFCKKVYGGNCPVFNF